MLHGGNVWQGGEPSKWLDFSANLRPEGTADWALECMARGIAEARYYPQLDMSAARTALAEFVGVAPECLMPTAGGIAAIDAVCAMSSGRVLIMPPTFGEYVRRARARGHETAIYTGRGSHAWGNITAGLFGAVTDELRSGDTLFLCNPNNPSGETLERSEVLELLGMVAECGAKLVVDEAFIDYYPAASVMDVAARGDAPLIVVASLTKILGVPGARLGYMVAAKPYIARAEAQCPPWSLNCCAAQIARNVAAHAGDIAEDSERNIGRRTIFERALSDMGIKVYPSKSNFLLLSFEGSAAGPAAALQRVGILTRDCSSFGVLDDTYMRVSVRTEAENARFAEALGSILTK